MNKWGIPEKIEKTFLLRDKQCVYCQVLFSKKARKTTASWEHIINDIRITSLENIALCCVSCNASKSTKSLKEWFKTNYCIDNNINENTVAQVVKNHILKYGN
jgi:hypothetical protein